MRQKQINLRVVRLSVASRHSYCLFVSLLQFRFADSGIISGMRNVLLLVGLAVFVMAGIALTRTVSTTQNIQQTQHIEDSIQQEVKKTQDSLEKISPAAQEAALQFAIQDEYHAEAMYQKVITTFGPVKPFVNIVNAESRHSGAIARVMGELGLAVPAPMPIEITLEPTIEQVCTSAVAAEKANIALYERLMGQVTDARAKQVFEANMRASAQNHLPAFELCSQG